MERLRVVTFNIAHGRGLQPIQGLTSRRKIKKNLDEIAALLASLRPDLVALQEIDQASTWAGNFDHLEYLREATGMPHAVFGLNNRHSGLFDFHYGNAFLSRHPLSDVENITFGNRRMGEKGFLFAELTIRGFCVPILNMHLHYRSRVQRFRQIERVMEYVAIKHNDRGRQWVMPPIVCGDFNNPAINQFDATARLYRYFMSHGNYSLHPAKARTFPSLLPQRTLDFIFLPPQCSEVYCLVVNSRLSDHRPVFVEFKAAMEKAAA